MIKNRQASIRWRMVLIYFLLVFIAMSIVSVFLLNRTEAYQLSSLQQNIEGVVRESGLLEALSAYDDLDEHRDDIQKYLSQGFLYSSEEISVINKDLTVIASTNGMMTDRNASSVFDAGLITAVMANISEGQSRSTTADKVEIMNKCYPIMPLNSVEPTGTLYVRADLTSIETLLRQNQIIYIQATALALLVTIVLGFILATNITEPINSVTQTVKKMSEGDFSNEVPVRSNDEIGQLAMMFNLMQGKLDETMGEMQDEKSKLEAILKYMADGLIAISSEGEIIHINRAARKMLNVKASELRDINYESLIGHLSPELELSKVLLNSLEGETELSFDYGGLTFAVRYDRFANEEESAAGVLILLQDITERQKLEDMQKDFVANVSHELKTPLATVKAYTETLMDGGVDPETSDHFLEIINSEADRMARLVKDLLQLSRLDHRQEKWSIKERDFTKLLSSCVEKMLPIAAQKKQTLSALFDKSDELRVAFDRDRMEQVVLNIISNAVKYTEDGGLITVDARREGAIVRITVKDNGAGIAPEDIGRIFERFYRVDKARSRAMGSSGLGLAISRQIVEEHHGSIEASSVLGEGTTMTISLPLVTHRGIANIE